MKNKINKINDFFQPFIHLEKLELNNFYFDLHLHTRDSDSNISVQDLAKFLHSKNYLVAITDHNSIGGIRQLDSLGIKVVPGIEIGCDDGMELLVYFKSIEDCEDFYEKYILPNRHKTRMARTSKDIWFYFEALKNYDNYSSIPHINGMAQKNFLKNKKEIFEIIKKVNAIEIHNFGLSRKKNSVAKEIKNKYNLEGTYGSDAHSIQEVKSFYKYLNKTHSALHKSIDYIYKVNVIAKIGYSHFKYMINRI